ncbi:MAG: c-type cytochrome [Gemmatimonadaceae bacterium]|nr:c-type cytochrome [Gemmatimonadaceae bacterium]
MPRFLTALTIAGALMFGACKAERQATNEAATTVNADAIVLTPAALAVFAPLPAQLEVSGQPLSDAKIALGRTLFYETLLSDGHDVSCNSCHALNGWGADGRKVSLGHDGRAGTRNAPTVYNAAGHFAQFWDGRASDVEAQAKGPILNPVEMGMLDSAAVLAHLRASKSYVAAFRAAFSGEAEPITYDNVGRAIGAFERKLVTPARWDRLLSGDSTALTAPEREGLQTFMAAGCQQCHNGAFVGGGLFQKAGLVAPWFAQGDSGRYQVTKDPKDLFVFKVPSLRNVDKTGPYFHDGSVASLEEAVRLMAHHQLGKELTPAQVTSIVTWLGTLTGEIPVNYIASPQRPAS